MTRRAAGLIPWSHLISERYVEDTPHNGMHATPFCRFRFSFTQTNNYVNFCTTEPAKGEADLRAPHQAKKSRTLGKITLPDPAFEEKHIYGMLGLTITMRLTKTPRMGDHWSLDPFYNFPLVRRCMRRQMFELLYCRFIHCSDGRAPKRLLPSGQPNPAFDSTWHIRRVAPLMPLLPLVRALRLTHALAPSLPV